MLHEKPQASFLLEMDLTVCPQSYYYYSSRTVNSFKNCLDKHWEKIPQMSELTGSNHRCRAQFKSVQTVVGQRFAGNGPNGLSYYYYDYYYY